MENPYAFTGRRFDEESGLFQFRNRYYGAEVGRFVSRDPLGYADGGSLYGAYFVPGGLDPWGLADIVGKPVQQADGTFIAAYSDGSVRTVAPEIARSILDQQTSTNSNSDQIRRQMDAASSERERRRIEAEARERAAKEREKKIASIVADLTPYVSGGKASGELYSGRDPITGEPVSRVSAVIGFLPGGKILGRAVKGGGGLILNALGKLFGKGTKLGATVGPKIAKQMEKRGWTTDQIREAIDSGSKTNAVNKANGNPATRHVHPTTGQSVVVDDATGEVIHIGGPGFKYGPESGDCP